MIASGDVTWYRLMSILVSTMCGVDVKISLYAPPFFYFPQNNIRGVSTPPAWRWSIKFLRINAIQSAFFFLSALNHGISLFLKRRTAPTKEKIGERFRRKFNKLRCNWIRQKYKTLVWHKVRRQWSRMPTRLSSTLRTARRQLRASSRFVSSARVYDWVQNTQHVDADIRTSKICTNFFSEPAHRTHFETFYSLSVTI